MVDHVCEPGQYAILGTIQSRVNGQWRERSFREEVEANSIREAVQKVLDGHIRMVQESDPQAIVRWYNPPRVSVIARRTICCGRMRAVGEANSVPCSCVALAQERASRAVTSEEP